MNLGEQDRLLDGDRHVVRDDDLRFLPRNPEPFDVVTAELPSTVVVLDTLQPGAAIGCSRFAVGGFGFGCNLSDVAGGGPEEGCNLFGREQFFACAGRCNGDRRAVPLSTASGASCGDELFSSSRVSTREDLSQDVGVDGTAKLLASDAASAPDTGSLGRVRVVVGGSGVWLRRLRPTLEVVDDLTDSGMDSRRRRAERGDVNDWHASISARQRLSSDRVTGIRRWPQSPCKDRDCMLLSGIVEWSEVRDAFVASARWFECVADDVRPEQWSAPGLGLWNVRQLVGHSTINATMILDALDSSRTSGRAVGPFAFWDGVLAESREAVHARIGAAAADASNRLGNEPGPAVRQLIDRSIDIVVAASEMSLVSFGSAGSIALADFLPSRIVEFVAHGLDLCRAIGRDSDDAPLDALRLSASWLAGYGDPVKVVELLLGRSGSPYNVFE